jgi:hypothetical protein
MSTGLYEQTLGDCLKDYDALLSLDLHNIDIGKNTSGDDLSMDSSNSSDNTWIQNVDIRTGARPRESVTDEDYQSSDKMVYQDSMDYPGQLSGRRNSSPSQEQKNLFKATTSTTQSEVFANRKADVTLDQGKSIPEQFDEEKVAAFENWEERRDEVFKRLLESQRANRISNKRIIKLETQQLQRKTEYSENINNLLDKYLREISELRKSEDDLQKK